MLFALNADKGKVIVNRDKIEMITPIVSNNGSKSLIAFAGRTIEVNHDFYDLCALLAIDTTEPYKEPPQEPETPEESPFAALEGLAEGAAQNGMEAYRQFWQTCSKDEMKHLQDNGFHETFKNIANEVDASVKA